MKTGNFVYFLIGAGVGSAAVWILSKRYYDRLVQEEINSVKAAFSYKAPPKEDPEAPAEPIEESEPLPEKSEMRSMASSLGYSGDKPYVISPDDFGEFYDYTKIGLTYYADHVLADELDEPVENVDDTVGLDSLKSFGQFDEDCVYVRNDRLRCDFEIAKDERTYEEAVGASPRGQDMHDNGPD